MCWFLGKRKEKTIEKRYYNIICPFCYEEFAPTSVKFLFKINGIPQYLSAEPNSAETKKFLSDIDAFAEVFTNDETGLPMKMYLKKPGNATPFATSFIRVCKNCSKHISPNAGTYSSDNGFFVLGLKSSGKTVYVTSVINQLKNVLPQKYGCAMKEYNSSVATDYNENYYNKLFRDRVLPEATILEHSQLSYEISNKDKLVGLTISDIKGEISNNVTELLTGDAQKAIEHSKHFILIADLKEIKNKQNEFVDILNQVLSMITSSGKRDKYLALVFTKSDELANFDEDEVFRRDGNGVSPIYKDINHKNFDNERRDINVMLKKYLDNNYPAIVGAAEAAFLKSNINYFAVSALGAPPVKGKIQEGEIRPIRVEEPIIWLLKKSGIFDGGNDR